jgi:energy-coupling factor transporter ATP-binding protein EcfA2
MTVVNSSPSAVAGLDQRTVADRIDGLRHFLAAVEGHLPEPALAAVRTVVDRAGERLSLSQDHTVVALAGSTGSGKSSLFNALAGDTLSEVGVYRPTTGVAHSCIWGSPARAAPLLGRLGVPPARRFIRDSGPEADHAAALRGLILLDLPDFDSVEESHRVEVDRLLGLVDLVVWVLDPQKYADHLVHHEYLARLRRYRDITVVVLNQADLLAPDDAQRCVLDLRRLLDADGLGGVPAFATSAVTPEALNQLETLLERTVAARQAALHRLAGDIAGAVADLTPLAAADPPTQALDRGTTARLTDALATAAGVPAVAAATERAYLHRSARVAGWPVLRWLRRLRPDPLRRLHIGTTSSRAQPIPATSVPPAGSTQQATVALAVRTLSDHAGRALPAPWRAAVTAAARSRQADLPDALDVAVAGTDLGLSRIPAWWRAVGALQWLATLTALVGLAWLGIRLVLFTLGMPAISGTTPALLLLGGLAASAMIAILVRPLVRYAAARARRRAETRLRSAIAAVAQRLVLDPVRQVLASYAEAHSALRDATARP